MWFSVLAFYTGDIQNFLLCSAMHALNFVTTECVSVHEGKNGYFSFIQRGKQPDLKDFMFSGFTT